MSNSSAIPEAELIAGLQARSHKAFAALYDNYASTLLGVICKIVHNTEAAETLLEDTFVSVWQSMDQYDARKERLLTWVMRIARTKATHFLQTHPELAPIVSQPAKPTALIGRQITSLPAVTDLTKSTTFQLEPGLQQLIDLLYFDGYTQQQAADALQLPISTIKTRTRMALTQLKNLLGNG